ncbi:MAG: NADPH-dependent FMN reductase [Gemmatimonadota bacterium]|nr:NADPH-dependent FMN reductase [Gemmatimonadota bacterium]
MSRITVLGLAGSLREGSFNRALLRAAIELADERIEAEVFDLRDMPFYNRDVEDRGDPEPVTALKEAVRSADLVVIATPEYNQSLPAVTKNAVDWASRPPKPQAWDGKPVAILGTSPGRLGTVSSQRTLRETLSAVNAYVMPRPRFILGGAAEVFEDGRLVDESTRERLRSFMSAAADWAERFMEDRT